MEREAKVGNGWKSFKSLKGYNLSADKIELTFAVKLSNAESLHDTLIRVSSPSSSDYGKLMSFKEVNELTNPSAEAVREVTAYLSSFGIKNIQISGGFIRAVVDLHIAEKVLSADYQTFQHAESGSITTRCAEYSLPERVAQHVDFVSPAVNFPRPFLVKSQGKQAGDGMNAGAINFNTPDSLRALYQVNEVQGGKSSTRQAVTAFLNQYYTEEDLQAFYKSYYPGLLGIPIAATVGPNGPISGIEAALDVEYMTVMGAGVPTEFWSYAGSQPDNAENEPFLDFLVQLGATEAPPMVFSTSYGEDEASVSLDYATRMNQEFAKNALRGVTFLFASGDSGVGSAFGPCTTYTPQFPSDSPYVTAVGATNNVSPEVAAGLSSGGFSNRWARPSWQQDAVQSYLASAGAAGTLPSAALFNASGRGFPDVSAQGTGFVVVSNGHTYPSVAGTSCSSPTFGGVVALLNDARVAAGKSPMGFLNPFIYAHPAIFNDVLSGNNPGCSTTGFEAAAGWDPVTGYGTPNYPRMLEAALALP